MDTEIQKYIKQLSADETIALDIARKQLGTSLNIEKSIGFINWKKISSTTS